MSDEKKIKVSTDIDFSWAVLVIFVCFWMFGGWYRVDCALGVAKACERIASEKDYSTKSAD